MSWDLPTPALHCPTQPTNEHWALPFCLRLSCRLDAYYELGLGGCWDLAAATLILEEAGGRVLDPTGRNTLFVCVSLMPFSLTGAVAQCSGGQRERASLAHTAAHTVRTACGAWAAAARSRPGSAANPARTHAPWLQAGPST